MPYSVPQDSPTSPMITSSVVYGRARASSCHVPDHHASSSPQPGPTPLSPLKSAFKLGHSFSPGTPSTPSDPTTSNQHSSKVRSPRLRSQTVPVLRTPSDPGPSSPRLPSPTKSVRFPADRQDLEGIRTFRKHGKPIHISHPATADETATETDDESTSSSVINFQYKAGSAFGFSLPLPVRMKKYSSTHFPKPSLPVIQTIFASGTNSVAEPSDEGISELESRVLQPFYEIDKTFSSKIPSYPFDPLASVHLESLHCSSTTSTEISLTGTVIVRNQAYSKDVLVHFTLDEWATVSDISARYVSTLASIPLSFFPLENKPLTPGDAAGLVGLVNQNEEWDRFQFTIPLDHASYSLSSRTLWLAVRFSVEGRERWDNNSGQNYKVGFRLCAQPDITDEPADMTQEDSPSSRGAPSSSSFVSKDQYTNMPGRRTPSASQSTYRQSRFHISHTSFVLPLNPPAPTLTTGRFLTLTPAVYALPKTISALRT